MKKYHSLISIACGLGFLIVLQVFSSPVPVFRFLFPAFAGLIAAVLLYNYWYLTALGKYNHWILLRPVLLLSSGFGLFLLLPNSFLRGWFLLCTAALIAFFQYFLENFAENVLLNETLIVVFGCFAGAAAYNFYFPKFHLLYTAFVFFGTFLATRAFYEFIPQHPKDRLVSCMVIALLTSELFWTLTFLPFHYSVLAVMLFNLYYFCLMMQYYHVYNTLNWKKIQFHFALMAACVLIVLFFTPWSILR